MRFTVKEYKSGPTVEYIMGNGVITKSMEMAFLLIRMAGVMMVNLILTKSTEKESTHSLMVDGTMVIGQTVNSMVRELIGTAK